ncbi:hypothetical protein C8A03DRAFT_20016 [Achaetomium macrosporum]|uniref:Uncharacterized protein n=1 Tax=Achaetomium macrosporum TaxID=79813 RepID=A0AAN7C019_9PEZI|nr:hypothetical protein C8A03DRAFT_20016 [Achaetomium macrosporum]
MDDGKRVDIAAIIIGSAIAFAGLLIAIGQFLSQIFGSVEGYRCCQSSVLGIFWSKKTTTRWRWTQFRYEVLFTTPEIVLVQPTPPSAMFISDSFDPVGSGQDSDKIAPFNELVCWIPFLESVHEHHENLQKCPPPFDSVPMLFERRRSWDFMPPDVIRPYASTTLSDIAILARRMGMVWTEFKPAEGVLQAQSNEHVLTSTVVRGLGLMLSYRRLSGSRQVMLTKHSVPRTFVCSTQTDMMWFGILPGNTELKLPDLGIGTNEDVQNTLMQLDPTGRAGKVLKDLQHNDPRNWHGICDIVPMVAPWLRQSPSTINPYPRPCPYAYGLTWYCVAYHAFYDRLRRHNGTSKATGPDDRPSTRWVQKTYEALHERFGEEWDGISRDLDKRGVAFFDTLEHYYEETTRYFLDKAPQFSYMDLVTAHLREAPRSHRDAQRRLDSNTLHWKNFMNDRPWRGEAMVLYWEYMPNYVRYMRGRGYKCDDATVEEAWIILVFRAFLWQRTHVGLANEPALPSRFYGSGLPVYIG